MQTINECEVKLNNNIRIHICTCILMEDHLTSKLKKMGQTVNRSTVRLLMGKGGVKTLSQGSQQVRSE